MKPLVLLLGCLSLSGLTNAWAQPTLPRIVSVEKHCLLKKFSVSTFPDANVPAGGDGDRGKYSYASPQQTTVKPDKKYFYAVVSAEITVPTGTPLLSTITVKTRQVDYRTRHPYGPAQDITLTRANAPSSVAAGNTTWVYSTANNPNVSPNPATDLPGKQDWRITTKLGRWELKLDPASGSSKPIDFKIDKRRQITTYARDWAALGLTNRRYPPNVPANSSGVLFSECSSFVAYVYDYLGLKSIGKQPAGNTCGLDLPKTYQNGLGDIRKFAAGGHYAIIDGGEMIDNNNGAYGAPGPTVRSYNDAPTLNIYSSSPAVTLGLDELYQLDYE